VVEEEEEEEFMAKKYSVDSEKTLGLFFGK